MKKIYSLLISCLLILNLSACSLQAPKQNSEVLLDLPSLLSTAEGMSIDKAKKAIKEAYDKGDIIGYFAHFESGEKYKDLKFWFKSEEDYKNSYHRGVLQLNGCSSLAVCIPCKEGSYSLEELKELLKRYGIQQAFNERTTTCRYTPIFNHQEDLRLLPQQLGDEFSIYCLDNVASNALQYSYEHNLSVEEESSFYTRGAGYKYSVYKTGSFLFVYMRNTFDPPPTCFGFPGGDDSYISSSNGVKGWEGSSETLEIRE